MSSTMYWGVFGNEASAPGAKGAPGPVRTGVGAPGGTGTVELEYKKGATMDEGVPEVAKLVGTIGLVATDVPALPGNAEMIGAVSPESASAVAALTGAGRSRCSSSSTIGHRRELFCAADSLKDAWLSPRRERYRA
jgi:hypothetical protein